jgi:alpha-L-fucosidase 2
MLVFSRPGVVEVLPAIPASLHNGIAKGILCRTQTKIDSFEWNLERLKSWISPSALR